MCPRWKGHGRLLRWRLQSAAHSRLPQSREAVVMQWGLQSIDSGSGESIKGRICGSLYMQVVCRRILPLAWNSVQ